jgi:ribosomal protein S18 acetylase RimI-like enzyme
VILYKRNSATKNDLLLHLEMCDSLFIPPLTTKVALKEYAVKIHENGILFEAWNKKYLIGLIATYFNDPERSIGFITNVSVVKEYNNKGVATELLKITKKYAIENDFKKIKLEVNPGNEIALQFYIKNNFKIITKEANSVIMELLLNINSNNE